MELTLLPHRRTEQRAVGQRATIRSRRSCSRFSVWPHFQSLNAGKNLKTLARRKGRNNTTIGLKSRPRPNVRNTRTVKDNFDHLLRSDQLRTMARLATKGRIWVSMYSCHTGLSEDTKSTSFPVGSHQSQMSKYTMILFRTRKTNPTTRSGRTRGSNKTIRAASQTLRANNFFRRVCAIKPLPGGCSRTKHAIYSVAANDGACR
jgi:hypothetical protein